MTLSHFYADKELKEQQQRRRQQQQQIKNREERVEYDDESIFAFSPETKLKHERLKQLIQKSIEKQNELETARAILERDDQTDEQVQDLVKLKVAEMMEKPMAKIRKMKEEIPELARDVLELKKDFNTLASKLDTVSSDIRNSEREFSEMKDDLDVVIYQNSVIKHLMEAGDKIKVCDFTLNVDRKSVVIVDPNDFGTEVDAATDKADVCEK